MFRDNKKKIKSKNIRLPVFLKAFFVVLFFALFALFYFVFPQSGSVDYSAYFITDIASLITSLGIEVSFVTYIEQTVYNRSFRREVLSDLTTNTVIDSATLALLALTASFSGFFLPGSLCITILVTVFSLLVIATVFISMYFLSNETDPIKQVRIHARLYFALLENYGETRAFSEWGEIRSIFEECLSAGEYHFCEKISIMWSIRVYGYIEKHDFSRLEDKKKKQLIEQENHLVESFLFFLASDFGNAGRGSLLRLIQTITRIAVCLKMDGFATQSETAERTLFIFFRNGLSDEGDFIALFQSFFFVDSKAKRSDYHWSKKDGEKPGEYVLGWKMVIFDVCMHLLADGQSRNASLVSSLLMQSLLPYLFEEGEVAERAFSLYVGALLGFVNVPFPQGSELSVQEYFSAICDKNDENKKRAYVDKFLLSEDLCYKCVRDMPFADLILTQINKALLFGYKTKELLDASINMARQIVWAKEGVVASDIIPSDSNLASIIKTGSVDVDYLTQDLLSLFLSSASNEQTGYMERILCCIDNFLFQSSLPFDGKNPYLKLYYDLLEDIQQNSKEAAQKIIKHFDKDIRKADEENKLAEKELDAICEQIETFISWKTTSNIDEALGLAWELRGLVEENKIIRICQNSAPATRLVYSHLSSCAETAVENGQSEILQIMSASLGWGAVWEYKDRKRPDLSGYVLKCGVRLFVLCVNVLGDCSLSVFVGTLVIVHGAYSLYCKNISASQTIEGQLKEARINPVVILHKSLDLRKNQGSWSDLFGSRAKEFFNQYWKQLQATMPIGND